MSKLIVTAQSLNEMIVKADAEKRVHIIGRALVALFDRQTKDEKVLNDTNRWNMVGFSGADAKSGSLTAKYYLKHKTLLEWQIDRWMKTQRNGLPRLCKYWKQLNEIAVEKAATQHEEGVQA